MDVTEHPTENGKAYLALVLDAFSRRMVGWSIADHMRSELVVDALQMAIWRRRPPPGRTIAHSDHGSTYTSWAFGRRLRGNGLLGSMGSIGDFSTTPSPRASLAPSSLSCSTNTAGRAATNSPRRSSSGSRPGTTRVGDTATARCSVPWTTKPHMRHDQRPTATVRRSGGSSGQVCRGMAPPTTAHTPHSGGSTIGQSSATNSAAMRSRYRFSLAAPWPHVTLSAQAGAAHNRSGRTSLSYSMRCRRAQMTA